MSDAPKKPDLKFDEKTAIMTNPALSNPTLELNLDDDVVDENFSFDQKTVVQTSSAPKTTPPPLPPPLAKITPPPLPPPLPTEIPKVPEMPQSAKPVADPDAMTGSFSVSRPKMPMPPPTVQMVSQDFDEPAAVATSPTPKRSNREINRGAVKIEVPTIAPGDELEFEKKRKQKASKQGNAWALPAAVENLMQNKRALAGVGGFLVLFIVFGVWKSQQPKKLDLHLDESTSQSSVVHENASPSTGSELPTAEQVAARFEAVFQKVQADGGDVSR